MRNNTAIKIKDLIKKNLNQMHKISQEDEGTLFEQCENQAKLDVLEDQTNELQSILEETDNIDEI
jgi:hypothetical protein